MHYSLLEIIVCPICKEKLELKSRKEAPLDEVDAGRLNCQKCSASYPVKKGIPRFLLPPAGTSREVKLLNRTRERFSFSWEIFSRREIKENWHKDSYDYLDRMPLDFLKNGKKVILDLGCGMGSDIGRFTKSNTHVIGVDIADSIEAVNQRFKGQENIDLIQADIYNLPFKEGTFDLIYCLGVLHHLPNIKKAFKKMVDLTKRNGAILVYLYEDFSDRGTLLRILLSMVNFLRFATSGMNTRILYLLCVIFSPLIWILFSLPSFILKNVGLNSLSRRLPFRHTLNLNCIVSDLYDRFSPPIENRYSQQQVKSLFKEFHLNKIFTIKYRGWVALGVKQDGS